MMRKKVLIKNTLLRLVVQFSLNFLSNWKFFSYLTNELVVQVHALFFLALVLKVWIENSEILILPIAWEEEALEILNFE